MSLEGAVFHDQFLGNRLDSANSPAVAFVAFYHLSNDRPFGENDIISVKHRKRLITYKSACASYSVSQSACLLLA